jgi:hypothetical protein
MASRDRDPEKLLTPIMQLIAAESVSSGRLRSRLALVHCTPTIT